MIVIAVIVVIAGVTKLQHQHGFRQIDSCMSEKETKKNKKKQKNGNFIFIFSSAQCTKVKIDI